MLTETYLEGKFIRKRNIDLALFEEKLNSFIEEGKFSFATVSINAPIDKGVAFTITNKVSMSEFSIRKFFDSCLLIEFEEFKNSFAIYEDGNICLDLMHSRVLFKDFYMSIQFS